MAKMDSAFAVKAHTVQLKQRLINWQSILHKYNVVQIITAILFSISQNIILFNKRTIARLK